MILYVQLYSTYQSYLKNVVDISSYPRNLDIVENYREQHA